MKAENPLLVSSPFLVAPSLSIRLRALAVPLLLTIAACGGSNQSAPPSETPASQPATAEAPAADKGQTGATNESPASTRALEGTTSTSTPASAPSKAKVEFPAHANVDQAIKAVPQGQPRMNMADDALRAPLLDLKNYDKCKIPRSIKITMTVAVYDGAAVGADISSKPKNAKIEECVDGVVRAMTWSKVPSLNTVNVSF